MVLNLEYLGGANGTRPEFRAECPLAYIASERRRTPDRIAPARIGSPGIFIWMPTVACEIRIRMP